MNVPSVVKLLVAVVRLSFALLVLAVEVVCWIGYVMRQAVWIAIDAARAWPALRRGSVRCPHGHEIPLDGGYVYECTSCGFVYHASRHGNATRCPNPECDAPAAPYLTCPECNESVRAPFRWGRP